MAAKDDTAASARKKPLVADARFLELEELLYAPLKALAHSNMQLHGAAIDTIRSLGTVKQIGQEEIIYLNSLNMAYNHLKSLPEEGCSLETLQMKVPLLSLVPVSNLNVERAELDFCTEMQVTEDAEGGQQVKARICAPEQRKADFLPKVTYKMKVRSIAPMEGLLRITDLLNAAPVAKQLDSVPLSPEGTTRNEQYNQLAKQRAKLKNQEKRLHVLYQRITETMENQDKLQELTGREDKEHGFQFNNEKYQGLQENIMEDLMRLKEEILKLEIRLAEEEMA